MTSSSKKRWKVAVTTALLAGAFGVPASGDGCTEGWTRPYVCELELYGGRPGSRLSRLEDDGVLVLPAGEELEVEVVGRDQEGRVFPEDRFTFEAELDRRCGGLVTLSRALSGNLLLEAAETGGSCEAWVWVPGNLNLEIRFTLRVVSRTQGDYTRAESEWIARRLYEAILGREGEEAGVAGATAEIQRGRLREQVENMFRSREFQGRRRGLPASSLLEDFYRGLLGRPPDTSGVRSFLDDVERGRLAEVVLSILGSAEFENRVLREAHR